MKLGSANKWIELLKSGNYAFNDCSSLKWMDNTFCPVGVLEDFVTPGQWKDTDHFIGFCTNADGSMGYPSKSTRDKCKLKTNLEEAITFFTYWTPARCAKLGADPATVWSNWISHAYERL